MLIVIVFLVIFIVAIAFVFGIMFYRRHQSRKNQGKFLASFASIFFFFNDTMIEILKHEVEVILLSGIVHF